MIELNQLKQLICIAECGSISGASQALLLSQPALSRSMQRLEQDFGAPLFDHYKNKVVLNPNGELAVRHARQIVAAVEQMTADVQRQDRALHALTVACCTPAPVWDLEAVLQKLYDGVPVQTQVLDQHELVPALKDRQVSIAITPFEVTDPDLVCVPYLEEDLYVSLPPTHRLKDRAGITFRDLDGETMLLYSNIGFWYDMHRRTTPNTHFLIQGDRLTFNEIVKASTLPSFTSNLSIKREGKVHGRIVIPIEEAEAHVTFYLVLRAGEKAKYRDLLAIIRNYYDF